MPETEEKPILKVIRDLLTPKPASLIQQIPKPTPEEIAKSETEKRRAEERKKTRDGQGGGINVDRKIKRADDIIEDKKGDTVEE